MQTLDLNVYIKFSMQTLDLKIYIGFRMQTLDLKVYIEFSMQTSDLVPKELNVLTKCDSVQNKLWY